MELEFLNRSKALTVVQEEEVSIALIEANIRFPMADHMYMAAEWRIARDPLCGYELSGTKFRLIKLVPIQMVQNPILKLRYYIDTENKQIVVDWIKFEPYDKNQEVSPAAFFFK